MPRGRDRGRTDETHRVTDGTTTWSPPHTDPPILLHLRLRSLSLAIYAYHILVLIDIPNSYLYTYCHYKIPYTGDKTHTKASRIAASCRQRRYSSVCVQQSGCVSDTETRTPRTVHLHVSFVTYRRHTRRDTHTFAISGRHRLHLL